MTAKPEIGRRVTKEEAGMPPEAGMAWDEATQRWLPRGQVILAERMEQPLDLDRHLETFQRNRQAVLRFVARQLVESEYDDQGRPVPGRLGDFYVVPGSKTKALTKLGAEKMGQFFRYARGEPKVIDKTETKDYVSATVSVVLLDHFSRVVGGAAASASTAEAGFRSWKSRQKYGAVYKKVKGQWDEVSPPDLRAALNDVVSRAGKRAFVQAMIVATATDEIFHVADEERPRNTAVGEVDEPSRPVAELPFATKAYPKGTKLSQMELGDLRTLRAWCAERQDYAPLMESIELELDDRRRREEASTAPI